MVASVLRLLSAVLLCAVVSGFANAQSLTHSSSLVIDDGGSASCITSAAVTHANNSYLRTFAPCGDPFFVTDELSITSVEFGVDAAFAAVGLTEQPIIVRIYEDTNGGEPDFTSMVLLGEEEFLLEDMDDVLFLATFTTPIAVPCDSTFVVEINSPDGTGANPDPMVPFPDNSHIFLLGANGEPQTGLSYFSWPDCGFATIIDADAFFGAAIHWVITVNYDDAGDCPCAVAGPDCQAPREGGLNYPAAQSAFTFAAMPDAFFTDLLTDTITATGVGDLVVDVDCAVNITHTFIGDMIISLTEPAGGVTVTLHDETGNELDDLVVIFDDSGRVNGFPFDAGDRMQPTGPGDLIDFAGSDIDGDWDLEIDDVFPFSDDGTLVEWSLTFSFPVAIPDGGGASAESTLTVPGSEFNDIEDLDVRVLLSHGTPGQLDISVESPLGTSVTLADNNLTGGPGLDLRFSDDSGGVCDEYGTNVPTGPGTLADFDGEALAGVWTLTVTDSTGPASAGTLDNWELKASALDCAEPTEVTATSDCAANEMILTWTNNFAYAGIEIRRDGVTLATLAGTDTLYVDLAPPAGPHTYHVIGDCDPGRGAGEVEVEHVSCCPIEDLTANTECSTGDVVLGWEFATGAGYDEINITRDGVEVPGGTGLPGDTTSFFDLDVEPGFHVYFIEGVCAAGLGSNAVGIGILHAPYNGEDNLIWAPPNVDGILGLVDSGAEILDALVANGQTALRIPSLDYECMPDGDAFDRLWVCLGTFPFNHVLDGLEGTALAELVTGDVGLDGTVDNEPVALHFEGADPWGFDAPTPFSPYDGCEDGVPDGDGSLLALDGLSFGGLDLTAYSGVAYDEDVPGVFEFTDQMEATGTTAGVDPDLGGTDAGVVWVDDGSGGGGGYNVGVYYKPIYTIGADSVENRVICQSWELGGFTGDLVELIALYLEALELGVAPPPEDLFLRGDCSGDGIFNALLDALFLLNYQFNAGPTPPCFDAADASGDNVLNALLDALFILNYQFNQGPAPPAPGPAVCGPDPDLDAATTCVTPPASCN